MQISPLRRAAFALVVSLTTSFCLAAPSKPNVIFILADDLGFGDTGVTYQNSRPPGKPAFSTPHLDAFAASGVVLRQHYTGAPVCAPARASLLTGQSQGHCPIRDNQFDKPLPASCLTLASMLKNAGYRTAAIGKWGLAGHKNSDFPAHPMRRGFDDFFGYMLHGTGHVYYHDAEHPLMDGTTDVGAKYENVYDTDLFTARAKQFITTQHAQHPDQPFFLYLAYTAVHNALNVPGGAYPAGSGNSGGMQWPLKPTPESRNKWIHPDYADKNWTDPMKRYATMARRLDDGVGDVLQLLKDLGIDKDTLVVFTSDNGPANEGGSDPRLFDSWGPFDGFKRDVFEGGVREPTFAAWPGHIPPKRTDDTPGGFWDWMPTLAQVAGLPAPAQSDGVSLLPLLLDSGHDHDPYVYVEYFNDGKNAASKDVFARKHVTARGQQQLVRIGDFVGVRTDIKSPADALRLYDVAKDPHEDHDLAKDPAHADLLKQMNDLLVTARRPDASASRPYDDVPLPAVTNAPAGQAGVLSLGLLPGEFPYTPGVAAFAGTKAGTSAGVVLPEAPATGGFAALFTGYLTVPADGEYTFTAASDTAVHLWLHDARVLTSETGPGPVSGKIRLRAGVHPFRLAYRHAKSEGAPNLSLHYAGPSVNEQAIPATAFSATGK